MSETLQYSLFESGQASAPESSTSSRVVHPANRSALLETARVLTTSVICGPNTSASLAKLGPDGAWQKTSGGFSQMTMDGTFEEYSGSLPTLGIVWRGELFELSTQERPTSESASALWPTPLAMDALPPKSQKALTREAMDVRPGRTSPANLRDVVNVEEGGAIWPTPRAQMSKGPSETATRQGSADLQTAVLWSTPAEQDSKNSTLPPSQVKRDTLPGDILRELWATPTAGAKGMTSCNTDRPPEKSTNLGLQVLLNDNWATPCAGDAVGAAGGGMGRSLRTDTHGNGGQLNPDWVDCLMGFPAGWTRRDGPPLRQLPTHTRSENLSEAAYALWSADPRSELLFNSLEEPAAIYEFSSERMCVLRVNESFHNFFEPNYHIDKTAGIALVPSITREDNMSVLAAFRETAETKATVFCRFRLTAKSGASRGIRMAVHYWGLNETSSVLFTQFFAEDGAV